jgi:hypothetical protein
MAPGVIGIVRAPAKRAESIVAGGEGGSLTLTLLDAQHRMQSPPRLGRFSA